MQFFHAEDIWTRIRNDHILITNTTEDALASLEVHRPAKMEAAILKTERDR